MLRPDVDPTLIHVLERAMARDPAYRFADAAEMRAALHAAPTAPPATLMLPAPLPARRSRVRMVLAGLAVAAAGILGAILLIADPPPQRAPAVTPVASPTK